MAMQYKSLEEMEAENSEIFKNPPISDEKFDKQLALNKIKAQREFANAVFGPVDSEDDEDEDDTNSNEEE